MSVAPRRVQRSVQPQLIILKTLVKTSLDCILVRRHGPGRILFVAAHTGTRRISLYTTCHPSGLHANDLVGPDPSRIAALERPARFADMGLGISAYAQVSRLGASSSKRSTSPRQNSRHICTLAPLVNHCPKMDESPALSQNKSEVGGLSLC